MELQRWLLPHEAGRRLGVSSQRVRQLVESGVLRAERIENGWRLIDPDSVEAEVRRRLGMRAVAG